MGNYLWNTFGNGLKEVTALKAVGELSFFIKKGKIFIFKYIRLNFEFLSSVDFTVSWVSVLFCIFLTGIRFVYVKENKQKNPSAAHIDVRKCRYSSLVFM